MVHETEERVERQSKMSFEDALRLEGRTMDQLREQLRPQAEQRVKQRLALQQFALQEDIAVNDDEVVREYSAFMSQFGSAQQLSNNDVDLASPLAQSFRNSVFGRKVMSRLADIGRGQADAEEAEDEVEAADAEVVETPKDEGPAETTVNEEVSMPEGEVTEDAAAESEAAEVEA
jgi:trigger factor